jgi:hypothetical protein
MRSPTYGPPAPAWPGESTTALHPHAPALKHSSLGIASLILSIAVGIEEMIAIVVATVIQVNTPGGMSDESPEAAIIGLLVCGGILLSLIGAGLGIGGLCQPDRSKITAVLGLTFNGMIVLFVSALIAIGLSAG